MDRKKLDEIFEKVNQNQEIAVSAITAKSLHKLEQHCHLLKKSEKVAILKALKEQKRKLQEWYGLFWEMKENGALVQVQYEDTEEQPILTMPDNTIVNIWLESKTYKIKKIEHILRKDYQSINYCYPVYKAAYMLSEIKGALDKIIRAIAIFEEEQERKEMTNDK